MALEAGRIVDGKYRIVRLVGEGGMGEVYEAENVRIQRRVALKVLHGAFAQRADTIQRFEREAQAAGRIGNDHILEVLDLGRLPEGDFFMVMEFLDGEPLSRRIERLGRLDARAGAVIARQILAGLGAAHAAGIVHRDLKPDNIFVLRQKAGHRDFVKIIDFGISKFTQLNDSVKMTQTGAVMGTPLYLSPEQASGSHEADARSDLYAVGVILYEAITGSVPFQADTLNQLLFKIALSDAAPPQSRVPDLDPEFAAIVQKGMARDRNQRFQSASEFDAALEAWLAGGRGAKPPDPIAPMALFVPSASNSAPTLPRTELQRVASTPGPAPSMPQGPPTGASWATSGVSEIPARGERRNRSVWIAAGALLAIAAIAAYRFTRTHGSEPAPAASGLALSAQPPTPAAVITPPPAESASLKPEASAPASATAAAASAQPEIQATRADRLARPSSRKPTKKQTGGSDPKPPATPSVDKTSRDFGY